MSVSDQVQGIVLVNKPQGKSSNAVLQQVKRLFCAKKAGHTGNLDPLATGMLPICLGEATKWSQYLLDADKCYETTGLLGIKTNSADAMGEVIAVVDSFQVTEAALLAAIADFQGTSQQVPSMFSALKHRGLPLYKYARAGIDVPRQAREIRISELNLTFFDGKFFSLRVKCSKGTYIRNLVEDLGDRLAVGAHVVQLHRVSVADFQNKPMYGLDELERMSRAERQRCLLPMDSILEHFPALYLKAEQIEAIYQGKLLSCDESGEVGLVRLYSENHVFLGLGESLPGKELKAKRLLASNKNLVSEYKAC